MGITEVEAAEVMGLPSQDVFLRYRTELMNVVVDFVEEAMHDDEHIIFDFIYERPSTGEEFDLYVKLHCGKEAKIHYKSLGDLYDYLTLRAAQVGDTAEDSRERMLLCKKYGVECC